MMKQETWKGRPAKEGVCPKSSKSEVERKSHSLKCTNSGVPPEKLNFLTKKFPQISPGKHLLISISGFGILMFLEIGLRRRYNSREPSNV